MSYVAARTMSAAFQALGFEAEPSPDADQNTLELAGKYTSGDECYPEMVTLGSFLKVTERPDFRPEQTLFLLPTSGGPCRFGQYRALLKKILTDLHLESIAIISPTSSNGYEGFGDCSRSLMRFGWWALVIADILRKLLLKTRPYEREVGTTNAIFASSLDDICQTLAAPIDSQSKKLWRLRQDLIKIRDRFRSIPANYVKDQKSLVGLVGEIFCRLNDFSNAFLIEKIEAQGGEAWISDISEWLWYTNDEQHHRIIRKGKRFSKEMLFSRIKFAVQKYDEHTLWTPFKTDFCGYEEVTQIRDIMRYSEPYLPQRGALGEMVSSVGKTIYLYEKGADGVIDISPFSCMNAIVCEAVFPKVSQDHDNFPIRTFYFDGTQTTVEQDLEIFMELIRSYQQRKVRPRKYPEYFR
jgi:predicted nucleotide-binding protein (sugar kinase/HSP70/actin superfamily)